MSSAAPGAFGKLPQGVGPLPKELGSLAPRNPFINGRHDSGIAFGTGAPQGGAPAAAQMTGPTADQQFAEALKNGLYTGVSKQGGFGDEFFNKRRQAYIDYYTPQIEDQYGKAKKKLTFSLARSGTLDSSIRAQKTGELQKLFDQNKQKIADEALASTSQARNAIEDARSGLVSQLNATGDAEGAANSALTRASALSQPAAYSPLSQLFGDFVSGLGTQAAMERAEALGGPKSRYNTGLFATRGRVQVQP